MLNSSKSPSLKDFEVEHIDTNDGARPCIKKSSLPYLKALFAKYGYSAVLLTVYDDKCKKTIQVILHAEEQEQIELERIGVLEHIDFSASVARLVEIQEESEPEALPENVVSIFKKR